MSFSFKSFLIFILSWFIVILPGLRAQSASRISDEQNFRFQQLYPEGVMADGGVKRILQDHLGFIWIGTGSGLIRFDGVASQIYTHDVKDTTSLSADNILSLYEDRDGTLWAGTLIHGLNRFDRNTGKFKRYQHNAANPHSISEDQIQTIYQDRDGTMWVGTTNGLNRYDPRNEHFTRFLHNPQDPKSISGKIVPSILHDHTGMLWFGTGNGLNYLDRRTGHFRAFRHLPGDAESLSDNWIIRLYEDRQGDLWIGTGKGLNKFDRQNGVFRRFLHDPDDPVSISNNLVWDIREDRAGRFWIATNDGLNLLDRASGRFQRIELPSGRSEGGKSNSIVALLEDRHGAIWAGSGDFWGFGGNGERGLYKWDPYQEKFPSRALSVNNLDILDNKRVHCVYEDRSGTLWVGSMSIGLISVNSAGDEIHHYRHDPQNSRSLSNNFVMSLLEDRNGNLWVGTGDGGLNRLNRDTGDFLRFEADPDDPQRLSHQRVTDIAEDSAGILWLATFGGGLNRFDPQRRLFERFQHAPQDSNSLSHNMLADVAVDRDGSVWVGTWGGGLNHFDPRTGRFTRFLHDPQNPNSLSNNITWDVYIDRSERIWIATSGGLNLFDRAGGKFTAYTRRDGLAANTVFSILEDGKGQLWMSTKNGLSRFDPTTHAFKNFAKDEGLLNTVFGFGDGCSSSSSELIFSGRYGIDIFHPDSIVENSSIPPIYITSLTRHTAGEGGGHTITDNFISGQRQVELSSDDQTLTFEFTALSYRNAEKNQFAYKLTGLHDDWTYLGTRRSITFTSLAPGNYILQVKGSNNDGVWNEEGASLAIVVHPPWWKTWWAYSLYFALALGLLLAIRRYEMNRQNLKHSLEMEHLETEKYQELDRLKSKFFASISHEFRTPLTLIRGPVRQMLEGRCQGDTSSQYRMILRNCDRLFKLINQVLDLSKLESGKTQLKTRPLDIVALTRQLVMAFESLASVKNIRLRFDDPDKAMPVYLDREKYEKIIINLVSNAIKFTQEGGVIIVDCGMGNADLKKHDKSEIPNPKSQISEFVRIRVKDSGVGIPAEELPYVFDRFHQVAEGYARDQASSGIGLALTKELVELHQGSIAVESRPGEGSTFTVLLPLGSAHLKREEIASPEMETEEDQPLVDAEEIAQPAGGIVTAETNGDRAVVVNSDTPGAPARLVLILDDNPDMRTYIRGLLAPHYRVEEAEHGREGLEKARKLSPALIVCDVMMPEMDGLQFCHNIKTDLRTSHIPVVLLTARASGDSKLEGLETGADDYLTKPFDARELRIRVKNLIAQRRQLQERFRREGVINPSEVTATSMDEEFLSRVMAAVEQEIDNPDFDTNALAREIGVSRGHLNRKLRALTGQSVRQFIRTIRLKRAAQLLQQNSGNVTEVAYAVGFQSIAHFAKVFREEFGKVPSEFSNGE